MNLEKICQHTYEILEKNGWHENRTYDISFWLSELTEEGYQINSYAKSILEEFGNIYIREKSTEDYVSATFDFNPYNSASGEYDRIEEFEIISNDEIFPIGTVQDYILYAGSSHKIYLGDWNGLYLIGNSIEEFFENIFKVGFEPKCVNGK